MGFVVREYFFHPVEHLAMELVIGWIKTTTTSKGLKAIAVRMRIRTASLGDERTLRVTFRCALVNGDRVTVPQLTQTNDCCKQKN